VRDESAAQLLILTPGGKLVVRNSRLDTDTEYPAARDRLERYKAWLDAVRLYRPDNGNIGGKGN
jgi:hypothetical protein